MAHTHDFAVVGPGRHLKFRRARRALDGQRMVAIHGEPFRQPGEYARSRSVNDRGLAMHQSLRAYDLAAQRSANALVPETNAQDRQLADEMTDRLDRDTGLVVMM